MVDFRIYDDPHIPTMAAEYAKFARPKNNDQYSILMEAIFHSTLSGVYTSNLLNNLEFYLGQILSLYEAKSLGKYLPQIFSFIKGSIFGPNKNPNRLTNWMCGRRSSLT